MSTDKISEMSLPLDNPNENLETLSRDNFKTLFDPSRFQVRDENIRDKGVDFTIEVKKSGKNTNFRFLIQLKATQSLEPNVDHSFSLSVETSNINYLLNSGLPSYYVLFNQKNNTFYYTYLNDFIRLLNERNIDWQNQKSHTLRFSNILTDDARYAMYETALNHGLLSRELNQKLIINTSALKDDKILIDPNFNVTSDTEIRELIENIGLEIINQGRWQEILHVHSKASQKVSGTPKYNLILGIANYYNGNMIDALRHFKYGIQEKSSLPPELQNLLLYFNASVKLSMGIMSKTEYQNSMAELENTNEVGLYIQLENAKHRYVTSSSTDLEKNFETFSQDISKIINDVTATANIRLLAQAELLLLEGHNNNAEYLRGVAMINVFEIQFGPNRTLRAQSAQQFISRNIKWYEKIAALKDECRKEQNNLAYFNTVLNEVRIMYEINVYTEIITIETEIPGAPAYSPPDRQKLFEGLLEKTDNAYRFYSSIAYIENIIVTLALKYELLHFLRRFEDATSVLETVENLASRYDLFDHAKKIEHLKNQGTTHETLKAWLDSIMNENKQNQDDYDLLRKQMLEMDEKETELSCKENECTIELFPIGHFSFRVSQSEAVFNILNISDDKIKQQFNMLLAQGIIPVANILNQKIIEEGYAEGKLADQGIESWKNIFRVRKAFFDAKFYRVTI